MTYLLLLVGFVLLVMGGDYLVRGGSQLSVLAGVSPLLIGLGVASLGTSAPEAAVSIKAALSGHSTVSFGNIIGSNVANIGLALSLPALIFGLPRSDSVTWKEIPYSFLAALMLMLFSMDWWMRGAAHTLSRLEALVLLAMFAAYLYYLMLMARSDRRKLLAEEEVSKVERKPSNFLTASAMTLGGIGGVVLGGHLTVDNAVLIARNWGVSETLISVTVVALGTSLPEVATTVSAARHKQWDMALGNVIGSNIFNILFVLGLTAAIKPIAFPVHALVDLFVVLGITIVLFIFMASSKKTSRIEGLLLLLIYFGYVAFVVVRK
ncbi:calcium/sodium antiporter [Candidatus Fermentibacteria bacterium]|nr:calcium/sodium antiporter [Candidatus Fermentibacteria bacterium]